MLANYRTDTQNLLQKPGAPTPLYDTTSVDRWINLARQQAAAEGECIRYQATLATVANQRTYNFSSLATGTPASNGIASVLHVRAINYVVASGQRFVTPRPWEWFNQYSLNNPVPVAGPPKSWSQYAQGAAGTLTGSGSSGSFYLDPPPDQVYTLYCDCVCYPIDLVDDTTVEAIPFQFTMAVPFFAAYWALLSAQAGSRQAEAGRMYEAYETFLERARRQANPSVLRWQYAQAVDVTQPQKLGLTPKAQQGAG